MQANAVCESEWVIGFLTAHRAPAATRAMKVLTVTDCMIIELVSKIDAVWTAVNGVDGTTMRRSEPHSESSSSEDQELEEERRIVREQLSKLPTPKVRELHTARLLICSAHFFVSHCEF